MTARLEETLLKEEKAMEEVVVELTEEEVQTTKERIAQLKVEHRDLDDVISRLNDDGTCDELQLRRLKRRKLLLKDQIALLERRLDPDIPA